MIWMKKAGLHNTPAFLSYCWIIVSEHHFPIVIQSRWQFARPPYILPYLHLERKFAIAFNPNFLNKGFAIHSLQPSLLFGAIKVCICTTAHSKKPSNSLVGYTLRHCHSLGTNKKSLGITVDAYMLPYAITDLIPEPRCRFKKFNNSFVAPIIFVESVKELTVARSQIALVIKP